MGWTHFEDTKPRAHRRHRCGLCGQPIEVGEVHVARRGVDDDGPMTFRMHALCESLTKGWDGCDWESYDEKTFRDELLVLHMREP